MKKVLFFGIFDSEYSRTKILAEGFRENGYEVVFCRADPRESRGWKKYFLLYREARAVRHARFDQVLVCFPSRVPVLLIARFFFGAKIIFDAFLSVYDSNVGDRKLYSTWTPLALREYLSDWISCRLAWKVLLDTNEHVAYFVSAFGVAKEKCIRVLVGADEKVFYPREVAEPSVFTLHFHGTFIPLQGASYIIEAAKLLASEPILFRMIGTGQESESVRAKARRYGLSHVTFIDHMPLVELAASMASANACLGIFGDTAKTMRVIPNKVYEGMLMGKAVITADTPAMHELWGDNPPLVLVRRANPAALADAIRALMNNPERCKKIGREAAEFFKIHLTARTIVLDLLTHL